MKNKTLVMVFGVAMTVGASAALAQTGPVAPAYKIPDSSKPADKDGPRSVPLGDGVSLSPYFNLAFGRNDNLFLTNTNRTSSDMVVYNPGFRIEAIGESSKFGFGYDLNAGRFRQSSADDYTDYKVYGSGEFVMSASMGLKLAADYAQGHDPRGSTDRGISGAPDKFRTSGPSALFAYGANDAIGRFEVEGGSVDKRYLNNRITTVASDRNTDSFAGRFFVRVAPKTSFLFEARQDKMDYKLATSLQDSKETRYLVGVTWDATAATSGTIKVGQIKKDFSTASRKDFSSTGWEASIAWKPLSYSKVDLFTTKSFGESTGLGDFTLTKKYGAAWQHSWDSRFMSVISLSRNDDEFIGNVRNDETSSFGIKLNYKMLRWLTLGGEYNTTDRDSNVSGFNYKKNLYMLTLGATL